MKLFSGMHNFERKLANRIFFFEDGYHGGRAGGRVKALTLNVIGKVIIGSNYLNRLLTTGKYDWEVQMFNRNCD